MIRVGERIHFIGVAGSGAAGTALLARLAGALVDGCDLELPSPYTPPLDAAGIRQLRGHDPEHLAGIDRVATTPAARVAANHPELAAASERGITVITWQALLGELMSQPGRLGLAVAGTHGKSTTTALLGHLLIAAGLDPTVEVGAMVSDWGASVRAGGGPPFLVEADEFGDNFLNYHPAAAIITNIEMDHPDYFADRDAVLDSFERFVRGMGESPPFAPPLLLAAAADTGVDALLARLPGWHGRVRRFGPGGDAAVSEIVYKPDGTSFTLRGVRFRTRLLGAHNVLNATAALELAAELGAPLETLAKALPDFAGAGRRMELIADTAGVTVLDDYAHHPTEVRAALAAARQRVGDRRLWAIFEPHMVSRTALFLDQFASSFSEADEVAIVDIFPSRDADLSLTSAEELADAVERISAVPTLATGDVDETTSYLAAHVRDGDAVLVMGAGRSYRIARGLAAALSKVGTR
ncbi:MAG: UDP-N-acetylmuramate--L-alanine ligase [Candidatus Limnocylindria bacterium]